MRFQFLPDMKKLWCYPLIHPRSPHTDLWSPEPQLFSVHAMPQCSVELVEIKDCKLPMLAPQQ